jgi:hypothetical protein
MIELQPLRWGKPYQSLEFQDVIHFETGEAIAKVGQVSGGMVQMDMRKTANARAALKSLSPSDLLDKLRDAGELFANGTVEINNQKQTVDDFIHQQSASTGLPEHMCRNNMKKNAFVLENMPQILDALTRGLDLEIFARGWGEEGRGVIVSYQCQSPVLGAVLPNNSPGVHTLWLPAVPLQVGLVLKPGSQEPWTPYRMIYAFIQSGIPAEAFCLYPGTHDVGGSILSRCDRSMIFGSQQTIDQYAGNPKVQVHGPGFSKILIGDDCVDQWESYLDMMVESILSNSGRSCINASGVWASRHTKEISEALAQKLGPVDVKGPQDDSAELAAFVNPAMATGTWAMVQNDLAESGVTHMTENFGPRLIEKERCAYLRPVVVHADSPTKAVASKEYMFPFASVVKCTQKDMIKSIGSTLVCSAITNDESWISDLTDAVHIDRLNIGPMPTNRLNWLQPHEGNMIDFLYRSRAYQVVPQSAPA